MTSEQRPRQAAVAVALTLALALGAAGCTNDDAPPPDRPAPDLTGAAPDSSPSASPTTRGTEPPPWVTRPGLTRSPAPGATDPAPARSGRRTFPRPADLGPAWTYRQDFTVEEYGDRGTPVVIRDPRDVVRDAVPRGCPSPPARDSSPASALARPVRGAEVGYEVAGDWVDAVRVQFATPQDASRFADARRTSLRECRGRSVGAVGPLVTRVVDVDADTVLSDRTPESDAYSEVAVLDGDTVVLLTRRTDERPTLRAARALAAAFTGTRVPGGIS